MRLIASLRLPDEKQILAPTLAFIAQVCADNGLDEIKALKLRIACEEILLDRIENAYSGGGEVRVDLGLSGSNLEVSIVDKGAPYWKKENRYNPEAVNTAAIGLEDFLISRMADGAGMEKLGRDGQRFFIKASLPQPPVASERGIKDEKPLDHDFRIRSTRPDEEDIIKAIACIHNEYGYSYGYERLYYPELFKQLIERGEFHSFLAVNAHDQVAGHFGLAFSGIAPDMPEMATGVVKRSFRGNNLFDGMMRHLLRAADELGVSALMMQPTAYHTATQHLALRYGFTATGFLFHYTNPDLVSEYNKNGSRLDLAVAVKSLKKHNPAIVYCPPKLQGFVGRTYERLGIEYEFENGEHDTDLEEMNSEINPLMRSGKIIVWRSGNDFPHTLTRLTREYLRNKLEMIELLISINDPGAPSAYGHARKLGYVFTGFMPCGGRGDYLLLQHFAGMELDTTRLATEGQFTEILEELASLGELE